MRRKEIETKDYTISSLMEEIKALKERNTKLEQEKSVLEEELKRCRENSSFATISPPRKEDVKKKMHIPQSKSKHSLLLLSDSMLKYVEVEGAVKKIFLGIKADMVVLHIRLYFSSINWNGKVFLACIRLVMGKVLEEMNSKITSYYKMSDIYLASTSKSSTNNLVSSVPFRLPTAHTSLVSLALILHTTPPLPPLPNATKFLMNSPEKRLRNTKEGKCDYVTPSLLANKCFLSPETKSLYFIPSFSPDRVCKQCPVRISQTLTVESAFPETRILCRSSIPDISLLLTLGSASYKEIHSRDPHNCPVSSSATQITTGGTQSKFTWISKIDKLSPSLKLRMITMALKECHIVSIHSKISRYITAQVINHQEERWRPVQSSMSTPPVKSSIDICSPQFTTPISSDSAPECPEVPSDTSAIEPSERSAPTSPFTAKLQPFSSSTATSEPLLIRSTQAIFDVKLGPSVTLGGTLFDESVGADIFYGNLKGKSTIGV
ncbi:hypothetical protein J437_LFUL002681 [Ladona fulva]|uniref:Uncharacterized protein n=1 Tax=Ladona fulva TaxID=123851 RepID=A0A8K0NTM1_LADFU|nr:hypothetical protein J437_LFUL002681 [Ladona fulva]